MSARLNSSRTSLLRVNRLQRQNARLLELLYLACALLLGALLAATTLAMPIRRPQTFRRDERAQIRRATSPVVHLAPCAAPAEFDPQ
jgi:hypothetical protein